MSCGLELIVSDSREEFEAMEEELASCWAVHVNTFYSAEEFHAAARELLEAGLSPDDNYYQDGTGQHLFSLWYYLERTQRECNTDGQPGYRAYLPDSRAR